MSPAVLLESICPFTDGKEKKLSNPTWTCLKHVLLPRPKIWLCHSWSPAADHLLIDVKNCDRLFFLELF